MPVVSQAQFGKMGAFCKGKGRGKGPSRKVACEFLKASRGMKISRLPMRVRSRRVTRSAKRLAVRSISRRSGRR